MTKRKPKKDNFDAVQTGYSRYNPRYTAKVQNHARSGGEFVFRTSNRVRMRKKSKKEV